MFSHICINVLWLITIYSTEQIPYFKYHIILFISVCPLITGFTALKDKVKVKIFISNSVCHVNIFISYMVTKSYQISLYQIYQISLFYFSPAYQTMSHMSHVLFLTCVPNDVAYVPCFISHLRTKRCRICPMFYFSPVYQTMSHMSHVLFLTCVPNDVAYVPCFISHLCTKRCRICPMFYFDFFT